MRVTYCYGEDNNEILIQQEYYKKDKSKTQGIETTDDYVNYKGYRIYIEKNNEMATVIGDKTAIDIIGEITKTDIFNIIDRIKAS